MTSHVLADDDTTTAETEGAWLALSAALTDQLPALADREDLTVTCGPGKGHGAPGCFLPNLATIEVDGDHLGVDPATCDPALPWDRDRYPATWGVLVHEAAHARHSAWRAPDGTAGTAAATAAELLEESRIEASQIARRPVDRHWLRAAATRLILADTTADLAAGSGTKLSAWAAAHAAGLLLARVEAGILEDDEVAAVTTAVTAELGDTVLDTLRGIWRDAHSTADDNGPAMLDLGSRWCAALDIDPAAATPRLPSPDGESAPSPLAAAITAALEAVSTADRSTPAVDPDRGAARAAETAARKRSRRSAERVFDPSSGPGASRLSGTRTPERAEQAAARRLARALRAAGARERVATTRTSATPPGRLRMRDALTADAQRAAGAVVTAEPFTQTVRRHVPNPPLRLAVACDVSGSMSSVAGPVASAAWILNRAAGHVPDARTATVIFGQHVQPVTHPGRTPAHVQEFNAIDDTEQAAEAIDALDGALDLTRPGAARLLVLVSDGYYTDTQTRATHQRLTRLRDTGCAVLWLTPNRPIALMASAQTIELTDPATTADLIATAATRALADTGR